MKSCTEEDGACSNAGAMGEEKGHSPPVLKRSVDADDVQSK